MPKPILNPRLTKPYDDPEMTARMEATRNGQFGWPVLDGGGCGRVCGRCVHFPLNSAGRVPRVGSCGRLKAWRGVESAPRFEREAIGCSSFQPRDADAPWVGVKAEK